MRNLGALEHPTFCSVQLSDQPWGNPKPFSPSAHSSTPIVGMPTSIATPSLPATEGSPCQTAPEEAGPSSLPRPLSAIRLGDRALRTRGRPNLLVEEAFADLKWQMGPGTEDRPARPSPPVPPVHSMNPTEATGADRGGSGRLLLMVQRPLTFNPPAQAAFTPASSNRSTLLQCVTASLSTLESAVFGTHEHLHLTMKLSQCFKHSTNQVKILQTKPTYRFLLKVGDGFVFLLGSTATQLQVMERGVEGVSPEKCCGIHLDPGIQVARPATT